MEGLPEIAPGMRPSIMMIDSAMEAKDEGYAPPAEMPIQKLSFTPWKPVAGSIISESEGQEEGESSSDVRESTTSDEMEAEDGAPDCEEASEEEADGAVAVTEAPRENIKVFLRVRPLPAELAADSSITVVDRTTVALQAPEKPNGSVHLRDIDLAADHIREVSEQDKYHFTRVFGPETAQASLFDETARPLVDELFGGHSGLLFAYGPTNSGKTFTIQGEGSGENAGVLPRTLESLFDRITTDAGSEEGQWTVWVTYMEIYNENIFDLLDAPPKDKKEPRKVRLHASLLRGALPAPRVPARAHPRANPRRSASSRSTTGTSTSKGSKSCRCARRTRPARCCASAPSTARSPRP